MPAKEWLLPLAIGALAFGALLLVPEAPTRHADGAWLERVELAFRDVHAEPGSTLTLLGAIRPPLAVGEACLPDARSPDGITAEGGAPAAEQEGLEPAARTCPASGVLQWSLPVRAGTSNTLGDPDGGHWLHVEAAPPGPRLGRDGYNATRVTVHVFDREGELVFSNGNASEQDRLTRTFAPEQLPKGLWYIGAAAAPPTGTQRLPFAAAAFIDAYRDELTGLPVGGVLTSQTDALATWYGPLWVTMQVDELVHAP